ncbi:hypothetical protein Tco_0545024 [Tanacetum coccineum]
MFYMLLRLKAEHTETLRTSTSNQKIPKSGKWEKLAMDFIQSLPNRSSVYETIWVHCGIDAQVGTFPTIHEDYKTEKLAKIYVNEKCRRTLVKRLKTTRSLQKRYADNRRNLLNSKFIDQVLLKRLEPVAYRLKLPQELSCVHDTFHVSKPQEMFGEPDVHVPMDEIDIDGKFRLLKNLLEIVELDEKVKLKQEESLSKFVWNSLSKPQGADYTWEQEDQYPIKNPNHFPLQNPYLRQMSQLEP